MTVAELIEELRRLPPNQPVVIEWPGEFDLETGGGPCMNLGSIDELRATSAFSHKQPLVVISAAAWVR